MGNYLAYSDATGLYLKLIRTGETHPITLPPNFLAAPVDWFPDGAHLLIDGSEQADAARGLWSISVYGGLPRKLVGSALAGSVSPDGQRIAVLGNSREWGDVGNEIWTVNSDGTNPFKVVPAFNDGAIGSVAWAPDSSRIAYTRSQWGGYMSSSASVEIALPNQSAPRRVLSGPNVGSALYW